MKHNGVPKITKAWLEWAKQNGACERALARLKPGDPITRLAYWEIDWVWCHLYYDGVKYPDPLWSGRDASEFIERIAREVEIVDV